MFDWLYKDLTNQRLILKKSLKTKNEEEKYKFRQCGARINFLESLMIQYEIKD